MKNNNAIRKYSKGEVKDLSYVSKLFWSMIRSIIKLNEWVRMNLRHVEINFIFLPNRNDLRFRKIQYLGICITLIRLINPSNSLLMGAIICCIPNAPSQLLCLFTESKLIKILPLYSFVLIDEISLFQWRTKINIYKSLWLLWFFIEIR